MSTFRERIREELAKPPREDAGEKVPAQFEDVLFDFAEGLEEARPSLSPVFEEDRVHRLLVFPKHRRDLEYTAFRYRWTGSALRIAFGEEGDFDLQLAIDELESVGIRQSRKLGVDRLIELSAIADARARRAQIGDDERTFALAGPHVNLRSIAVPHVRWQLHLEQPARTTHADACPGIESRGEGTLECFGRGHHRNALNES